MVSRPIWLAMAFAAIVLQVCSTTQGLRVDIHEDHCDKKIFSIEEFGFLQGGTLQLDVSSFEFVNSDKADLAGFFVIRSSSETGVMEMLHQSGEDLRSGTGKCPIEGDADHSVLKMTFSKEDQVQPRSMNLTIEADREGIYELVFVNCSPTGSVVRFSARLDMYNPGPNYLSAGEAPLPGVLIFFFFIYVLMGGLWVSSLRRHKQNVHKIHHLMTAFLVLKILSTFCFAMEKHFINVYGYSVGWSFLYHIFRAVRAVMFMLVVVLIGTGWSVLKPALNDQERKLLLFALPLQLLANLFLAIADEMPPGSSGFRYWRFLFVWVDVICCVVIAMPIWQHIKRLESHVGIANKQAVNLEKLRKFRTILITVIAFVYVTRFMVFILGNTLNFKLRYWEVVVREMATVAFYLTLASMLFPRADSKYLRVPARGGDSNEYEDVGLSGFGSTRSSENGEDPFDQDMFFEDEHHSEFGLTSVTDVEMAAVRRS